MFGFFAEEAGLLGQPLVRGLGFVVGAGVASGLGAAPPVGLPRGQEQVLAQVHIPPQLVEQRQLIGGVVAVAEGGLAHDVAVLLLHVRVVVGGVRPRAGHEDHPLGAPGDQGVVDELSAVVTVQPDHRVRQPVSDLRDGRNDPGVGAVADGDVHGPPEVDVGSGQRPGVLTLEGVPAVSDQVDLEEPWGLLHLVHRLTYHDRRTQRGPGTGRGLRRGVPGVLGGFEHPVDRGRAHRHQLLTHLSVEPLSDLAQLTEGLQLGQGGGHDRGQVLPARLPDKRPHLDQDLEGVIPVRARPWLALDRPGRAPAPGRRRDRPPGIGPRPARDRDELVEHPAPVLLRSALVLLRVLPRDLMTCRHRQPLTHPPSTPQRPKQDPGFASSSPVRHAPHFASTLGESRRGLAVSPAQVILRLSPEGRDTREEPLQMPKRPSDPPGARTAADLVGSDYALPGTLASRYMRCGKTNCRCKAEPPVLHGPYLHWTRTLAGKTVTRTLTQEQASRYQPWFDNARRLRELITELEGRSLRVFLDAEG